MWKREKRRETGNWKRLRERLAAGEELWQWRDWLPAGLLTLLVGPVGSGKSALALHIAGVFLRGGAWPDGTPYEGTAGSVVWCETEASNALNLARVRAWNLPAEGIRTLPGPGARLDLLRASHRKVLYLVAGREDTRLIVVDSLRGLAVIDSTERAAGLTTVLANIAQVRGVPVLLTHHLRKRRPGDKGWSMLELVRGPAAITQYPRVIWGIDVEGSPAAARRLMVLKNNIGPVPPPLAFEIGEDGLAFTAARPLSLARSVRERAAVFLRELLADGPRPATEVQAAYEAAGYSRATIKRAKRGANVVSVRRGGRWYWMCEERPEPASEEKRRIHSEVNDGDASEEVG